MKCRNVFCLQYNKSCIYHCWGLLGSCTIDDILLFPKRKLFNRVMSDWYTADRNRRLYTIIKRAFYVGDFFDKFKERIDKEIEAINKKLKLNENRNDRNTMPSLLR